MIEHDPPKHLPISNVINIYDEKKNCAQELKYLQSEFL